MATPPDSDSDPVAAFMMSPLVHWIQLLLERDTLELEDLLDGVALNQIMLQIDPRPTNMQAHKKARNDVNLIFQNLMMLIRHIRSYYEEMRKQVIVMPLPNILVIVHKTRSAEGLAEMEKLLLLVLGCAVNCDRREHFVLKMQQLTLTGMETMMNHIKYITENTDNVLNSQWEELTDIPSEELDALTRKMSNHIHKLVAERDEYAMTTADVTLERDYLQSQIGGSGGGGNLTRKESLTSSASRQHLMVEINELKSKLRKAKQELDEKAEQNTDLRQECEESEALLIELRKENSELITDARASRALRDENDILKEKAAKASRVEFELEMLKEKLKDVDFYKQRVEELREDSRVLHDTKDLLEEQLEVTRDRLDGLVDAEKKIIDLKGQLHHMTEEHERDRQHIQELMEKNSNLELDKIQSMNESGNLAYQLEQARGNFDGGRSTILAELEESAHTKVLRLEKDNKHLQALVNTYKDSMKSSELTQSNMMELEKENQRLSSKLHQLQEHRNKEKQSVLDFEQLSNELAAERQRLETTLNTSRSTSERRIHEVEEENAQLNKTIESLRERAKVGGDARIKAIEKENKVLTELVNDVTSKLHKSDYERKQLNQNLNDVTERVAHAEVVQKENCKLEKQNVTLEKTVKELQMTCNNVEELEHKCSDMEVENRQLKKQVETLKQLTERLQEIEQDKNTTEQEATKLRRQVESLRKSCSKMNELEQDKLESENRADRLRQSLDTMKTSLKQVEKMELVQVELESELERVRSQLELSKERLNRRENEMFELEKENEQVNSKLSQLTLTTKKLERFDTENRELESENAKLEAKNKKLNIDVSKYKQLLENKTAEFDSASDQVSALNRQNKSVVSEIEELRKAAAQSSEIETDYKKLQKQQVVDRRTLTALREELVHEKLTSQQRHSELERLHTELEDIGITKEELQKLTQDGDNDKRFKALESRLEATMQKSLGAKDEKINSLESRLQESVNLNNKLRIDMKNLKREYEALSQRHQEEVTNEHQQSPKKDDTTAEIFKIKDHLISVERKNATLLADNSALKSSSHDLQSHVKSLQSQVSNLQRQSDKVQENNEALQKQCVNLQVENSTLQSQCTSLMSQNAQASSLQSSTEAEKTDLLRRLTDTEEERSQLVKDHETLSLLYERQTIEVEKLMEEQQKLKQSLRQAKQESKDLEEKYKDLMKKNNETNQQRESETSFATENLEALREAHNKLSRTYKTLNNEYEDLQSDHMTLKSSHNQTKLEHAKMEAETSDIKDHNQQLDITVTNLNNRCDVLLQLKENLEEENRHLMDQIGRLMSQNDDLLSQTLESKDQIYSEQKQYTERMQEIRRQKEKLEEKIMDIYRTPGHTSVKRKGFGATLRKTIQNLGKNSESRRRRDGLPPHSSRITQSHGEMPATPPTLKVNDAILENAAPASTESKPDNISMDSSSFDGSSETSRKNSASSGRLRRNMSLFNQLRRLYSPQRKGSYTLEAAENKRRSKLGGNMAYSTTAINSISVLPQPTIPRSSPRIAAAAASKGLTQRRVVGSSVNLRKGVGSVGNVSYPGERHNGNDSSDGHDVTPTKDQMILQKFLESAKKEQNSDSTDPKLQVVNGIGSFQSKISHSLKKSKPMKAMSLKRSKPMRAMSWATSLLSRRKPSWCEDNLDKEELSMTRCCPPTLDLKSLKDFQLSSDPESPEPESLKKSPTNFAIIRVVERGSYDSSLDEEREIRKRDTCVYIVRSKRDAASYQNAIQLSSHSEDPGERKEVGGVSIRTRQPPQPSRPLSMYNPSTKPVNSLPSFNTVHAVARSNSISPMSAVQRLDSLIGNPRAGSRTLSPHSSNENVTLRPMSSAETLFQRRPASAFTPVTPTYSYHIPHYRSPMNQQGTLNNDITHSELTTSTPVSSHIEDLSPANLTNMIRKDVPPPDGPPLAPSPIRRDVPPDVSPYTSLSGRSRNVTAPEKSPASSDGSSSVQRRPPTPKKDLVEDADNSTLWFEYGCV